MASKSWNWRLWGGFGLSLAALISYLLLFEVSRAAFWPSLSLFLVVAFLLVSGLRRAFREPQLYRGKIAGPVLSGLSVLVFGVFGFAGYEVSRAFPAARNAPDVGQRAPGFALLDANGKSFTLAQLLAAPVESGGTAHAAKGVLVFFYRGYW